jgi:hypothetical protein
MAGQRKGHQATEPFTHRRLFDRLTHPGDPAAHTHHLFNIGLAAQAGGQGRAGHRQGFDTQFQLIGLQRVRAQAGQSDAARRPIRLQHERLVRRGIDPDLQGLGEDAAGLQPRVVATGLA